MIGPHWYISLIGLSIIFAAGGSFFYFLWAKMSTFMRILWLLSLGTTVGSYLFLLAADPGVVPRPPGDNEDIEGVLWDKTRGCEQCKTEKMAPGVEHCPDCGVCIEGYDHHCPWVGKCIGKKNLKVFYVFLASIPVTYVVMIVVGVWLMVENQ